MPSTGKKLTFRAKNKDALEITVYQDIGQFWWAEEESSAKSFYEALSAYPEASTIHVRINSDGGDVFEAIAMLTQLRRHQARVLVTIDGKALSAASLLAMAGDEIEIAQGGMVMIHDPWSVAVGNAEELSKTVQLLNDVADQAAEIYAARSGKSIEDVRADMRAETWLTAERAVEYGLADRVGVGRAVMAHVDPGRYRRTPAALIERPTMPSKKPDTENSTPEASVEGAVKAERERIASIQRAGRTLNLDSTLIQQHIDDGTTAEAFHALALDAYAKAKPPIVADAGRPRITPGEDARDKFLRGSMAWLLTRSGAAGKVVEAAKRRNESIDLDPGEFRGLTMLDLARMCLERNQVDTRGMDKMSLVGRALTMMGGGYQTTGDFPVILENTLHKALQAAYAIAPDTWRRFCMVGSVTDFRAHPRYILSHFGGLDSVNEHGEFKNVAYPDGRKESITASTKGNILAITRQMIINDDMGALLQLAMKFGRASGLTIEKLVYALLALNGGLGPLMGDGKALFHADHKNIGTGAALSVAGLDADRVLMGSQTDDSGNEILELRPAVLLVPLGLGGDARVINDAQYDPDTSNKLQKPNKVRGLFRDIVDTARLTGTRRYLFADPADAPVLEVAFLDGQEEPFMEMKEGWRVDGVEWKVRLDVGAAAVDYKGAVTNAGA